MTAKCGRCSRPVGDQAYLCVRCTTDLERALGDVAAVTEAAVRRAVWRDELTDRCVMAFGIQVLPWERPRGVVGDLSNEIAPVFARQSRSGDGAKSSRSAERPLPYDARASAAGGALRNALTTWARVVLEERGEAVAGGYPVDSPRHIARWLLAQVRWLRHHPDAVSCADDLIGAVDRLRRTVDRAPELWFAGPCDGNGLASELAERVAGNDTSGCGLELYARPDAATVDCPACELTYDVTLRRDWLLEAAEDVLAHAELIGRAASALGVDVTPAAIRGYAFRGRIVERSTDLAGRPLYRLGDVIDVARDVLAERERRRAAAESKAARRAEGQRSA